MAGCTGSSDGEYACILLLLGATFGKQIGVWCNCYLPFSFILGLLASMTSTTMVRRRYAWIYATIQFALVVVFAHVFYSKLHVTGVLSVLLATFAGLGGAMCGTSIIYEFFKWRGRWHNWSDQPHGTTEIE